MDLNLAMFAVPAATGFCAWFGTVVGLRTDVKWLKDGYQQLKLTVGQHSERLSNLEGRNNGNS